jgi:hypothetical protein
VTRLTGRLPLRALVAVCLLALAACGGEEDKEGLTKACGSAAPAMKSAPNLPGNFPDAQGVVYTGVKKQGPTTVATGYIAQPISPAHDAYTSAVKGAAGYRITKNEQDVADAEVNFAGAGNSGQVKLLQECKDRTTVTITIRPA